jgi:hypothetical protein
MALIGYVVVKGVTKKLMGGAWRRYRCFVFLATFSEHYDAGIGRCLVKIKFTLPQ